jgi:hypothetical protein
MKMQHRAPSNLSNNMTGKLDPDYEAEVDKATQKLQAKWEKAQRKLEAARLSAEESLRRIEKAEKNKAATAEAKKNKQIAEMEYQRALVLIAEREAELLELEMMMTSTPAGSQNRGKKSFRSVPAKGSRSKNRK